MREQDTGQLVVRGGLFFFFFFNKASIRIHRTGRLHEDGEGARVFPVNNTVFYKGQNIYCIFFFSSL